MNELVSNNILAIGYLFLWVATFIWYHLKYQTLDAGSAIIGMYIIYAIFSIFAINDELFRAMDCALPIGSYFKDEKEEKKELRRKGKREG